MLKSPLCDGDASSPANDQTETNEEYMIQTTTTIAVAELVEEEEENNENNADSNDNRDDQDMEMAQATADHAGITVIIDEEEEVEEDNVVTCTDDDAEIAMQEEEDAGMGAAEKLPDEIQVKQEPMECASELLLDEELRLQIEKSIEMVVNEFSLSSEATLDESSVAADVEQLLNDENFNEMLETSECEGSGDSGGHETDKNDSPKVVSNSETERRNTSPVAAEETSSPLLPSPPPPAPAPLPMAELPSIRDDITVIPLSSGDGGGATASRNIKSEPGDSTGESCCRFKKGYDVKAGGGSISAKGSDCLSLISSSKNTSLTIVPVTAGAMQVTSSNPMSSVSSPLKVNHNDSKSLEFSLTPDVTIKTVLPSACRSNAESGYTSCGQNQLVPYYGASSFSNALPPSHYGNQYSGDSSSSRSHANYYENTGNGKPCIPTSELSLPCSSASSSASGQGSSCLYNKSNVSSYNSVPLPPPCAYSPSCYTNKPYANELPSPSLMHHQAPPPNHHSGASIPSSHHFHSNMSAAAPMGPCNFGGFQSASSPKYAMKPPPPSSSLNPCRMSASPIPSSSYMRSKEPLYGGGGGGGGPPPPPPPSVCNVLSDPCSGMMPPDSPSFRQSPTAGGWNAVAGPPGSACAVNSFRNPASSTAFNFPPVAAAAGSLMHHGNANPFPPSYSGQPMIAQNKPMQPSQSPSQHHSPYAANNFRNSYSSAVVAPSQSGGSTAAAAFQRSQQCCFSSQIQCFNSGCSNGAAQQQFSIVQHSTRLSNLKSNSMDSVSSLLQYHTYFKKY